MGSINDVSGKEQGEDESSEFRRDSRFFDPLEMQLTPGGSRGRSAGTYLRIGRSSDDGLGLWAGQRGRNTRSSKAGKYLRIGRAGPAQNQRQGGRLGRFLLFNFYSLKLT